jgi:hypothetical protein
MSHDIDGDFEATVIRTMHQARADQRVRPWPDGATRVRAAARRQARTRSAATAVGVAGLLGVAAAGVAQVQHTRGAATSTDAAGGGLPPGPASPGASRSAGQPSSPAPTAATPAMTEEAFGPITTGADWVLSEPAYKHYQESHPSATPAPASTDTAVSAAAVRLASQVSAVLPAGSRPYADARRDIDRGPAQWVRAVEDVNGQMVIINRSTLTGPRSAAELGLTGVSPTILPDGTAVWTVAEQVPSSDGPLVPGHLVLTVSVGGQDTNWAAPDTVPVAQLQSWAAALNAAAGQTTTDAAQPTASAQRLP